MQGQKMDRDGPLKGRGSGRARTGGVEAEGTDGPVTAEVG